MDLNFFTYIGIFTAAYVGWTIITWVYRIWKLYIVPTYPDFSSFGKWSVITGSTDGIGKSIAFELASQGQNLILIARNQQKLENVSSEIASKYGVQVKFLTIDFSHDDFIYDQIKEFLKGHVIGMLINNVGIGCPPLDFLSFLQVNPNAIQEMIRVNAVSVCKMIEIVLPSMLEHHRGVILTVSSAAIVAPFISLYGASKSFIHNFSETLSYEYANSGVIIQDCTPGFVDTKMAKVVPLMSRIFVSPDYYAKCLLATIGKERSSHGCWQHVIFTNLSYLLPRILYRKCVGILKEDYEKNVKPKLQ